jgi:hypothetical protein
MKAINSKVRHKSITTNSVWSVDRIARLIIGLVNVFLLLATYFISSYFIFGLCFINLNLVFSSLTDFCPFKNLLKKLGAKEREEYFNAKGELISNKKNHGFHSYATSSDSTKITLTINEKN